MSNKPKLAYIGKYYEEVEAEPLRITLTVLQEWLSGALSKWWVMRRGFVQQMHQHGSLHSALLVCRVFFVLRDGIRVGLLSQKHVMPALYHKLENAVGG